jgi:hypothetical protein
VNTSRVRVDVGGVFIAIARFRCSSTGRVSPVATSTDELYSIGPLGACQVVVRALQDVLRVATSRGGRLAISAHSEDE